MGQISFSDFLANQDITNGRGNDANPNLVPPQSWEATGEVSRNFGRWGKTRLKLYHYRIEDIVDHIPVDIDGDAVGNLPRATRTGIESISTIQFDPLGWRGAKLDADIGIERARVRDPLTGLPRAISNTHDRWARAHAAARRARHPVRLGREPVVRPLWPDLFPRRGEPAMGGPYASVFVELKDVKGMKVNFQIFNINDGHVRYWRNVYSGRRNVAPMAFLERQYQRVGPIFTLTISGKF